MALDAAGTGGHLCLMTRRLTNAGPQASNLGDHRLPDWHTITVDPARRAGARIADHHRPSRFLHVQLRASARMELT